MSKQECDAGSSKQRRRPGSAIIASNRRRRRVLERLKFRWRAAPATAHTYKPMMDLATDVANRHRDDQSFDKNEIWRELSDSVRLGFFDGEHRLFVIVDNKWRLTSKEHCVADAWNDEELRLAFLKQSWATVSSIAAWARCQHYALPATWQASATLAVSTVLDNRPNDEPPPGRLSKGLRTQQTILECFDRFPRQDREKLASYYERISGCIRDAGGQASPETVRKARQAQGHRGRNGNSVSA